MFEMINLHPPNGKRGWDAVLRKQMKDPIGGENDPFIRYILDSEDLKRNFLIKLFRFNFIAQYLRVQLLTEMGE